jgi:anti-anti-sigma regulatory factor
VRYDQAQLSVEVHGPRLRVLRVAGLLDALTVTRLACLAEVQLSRPGCTGHLVLDLGEVRFFGTDDFDALVQVRDTARAGGVRLHLTGVTARQELLPVRITEALAQFSMFPTVEQAQRELVGRPTVPAGVPGPRSSFGWPCPPTPAAEAAQPAARSSPA